MRRFAVVLFSCLLCAGSVLARAQVEPTAYRRNQWSLSVGGMGSGFQPDYAGSGVPEASPQRLYGFGVYADMKFTRWVQLEGEARWLRMNSFVDITQDNYLIGPRVPIHQFEFMHATPYGKALFGMGKMTFEYNYAYGRFADIALGGGVDFQLTKRITFRPDFEYQLWPNWVNGTLKPYGGSLGVAYRVF
jgi:Outer membrane protein beta-barrel domain